MNFYAFGVHWNGTTGVLSVGRAFRTGTRKQRQARKTARRKDTQAARDRVTGARKGVTGFEPAARRGRGMTLVDGVGWVDSADITPDQRAAALKAHKDRAAQCGQRTADGTPCRRRGQCKPGTHAPAGRVVVTPRRRKP